MKMKLEVVAILIFCAGTCEAQIAATNVAPATSPQAPASGAATQPSDREQVEAKLQMVNRQWIALCNELMALPDGEDRLTILKRRPTGNPPLFVSANEDGPDKQMTVESMRGLTAELERMIPLLQAEIQAAQTAATQPASPETIERREIRAKLAILEPQVSALWAQLEELPGGKERSARMERDARTIIDGNPALRLQLMKNGLQPLERLRAEVTENEREKALLQAEIQSAQSAMPK